MSDPRGHSHGEPEPAAEPLDPMAWRRNVEYCYGIDLYNAGFPWEAHEAWERVWIALGRRGETADFVKGLIKLAAACVKRREGRSAGVERHAAAGRAAFATLVVKRFAGLDRTDLLAEAERLAAGKEPTWLVASVTSDSDSTR